MKRETLIKATQLDIEIKELEVIISRCEDKLLSEPVLSLASSKTRYNVNIPACLMESILASAKELLECKRKEFNNM